MNVLVLAKAPVAGRVKTRLCPPLTLSEAAAIAAAALADTLDAASGCGADRRIVALDGEPGDWLPPGFEVIAQRGPDLATRLANAWTDSGGPGIQIGMDTPQVSSSELDRALAKVAPGRALLGHAVDGGWWVIGFADADPQRVFDRVPTSTPFTGVLQERRLRALGLTVDLLGTRRDIDTAADLAAVAESAPHTRTATELRRLAVAESAPHTRTATELRRLAVA
jgi:glycosyltransferase A (GT-A) superfamily protein (DUF2064 family)